jgi:hypothetical protein
MNPRHLAMATSLGIGLVAALVLLGLLSGGTSPPPPCRRTWSQRPKNAAEPGT